MMTALACLALVTQTAAGQAKGAGSFSVGYTDIGPAIGIGGINGASATFGGRLEHAFKALPDLGNGILGIQGSFEYYSWSAGPYSYKYVPLGVTANYHFRVQDEPKIDPFIGVGLGYQIISCSFSGTGNDFCNNSDIYLIARAGARYFFAPNMAFYGDVGAGAATLNLGIMFKIQ